MSRVADRQGDHRWVPARRKRGADGAVLVELADHRGRGPGTVAGLSFTWVSMKRALLLDDQDEVEPLRKVSMMPGRRARPAELQQPQAQFPARTSSMPSSSKRLSDVQIALAGRDDADLWRRPALQDEAVERRWRVQRQPRQSAWPCAAGAPARTGRPRPDVEPALRHFEVGRQRSCAAIGPRLDDGGRFHIVMHAFDLPPRCRKNATRRSRKAHNRDFLHAGGVEDRGSSHRAARTRSDARRWRLSASWSSPMSTMHAAMLRGTGDIGVAEHIAANGRRRGPCRTTCRTRRRNCLRRAFPPAGRPTARSPPDLR